MRTICNKKISRNCKERKKTTILDFNSLYIGKFPHHRNCETNEGGSMN